MLKLLCVLIVSFAAGYALDKKAEITWGHIMKVIDYPGVTIKTKDGKTEITWNEPINAQINPLRATFAIRFTKLKKSRSAELDNLCNTYEKYSLEGSVQRFALKTVADIVNCPIKKGAKATFSVPTTYSYSEPKDKKLCGPYRSEMKIFRKKDKGDALPIIIGVFRGNITGCLET
ncbi:uncharacterized protein LOC127285469 [Leptopilina boulardi]|uniref:uncharacterized protein LOC127285469 n=1 Tax=Leptopilina boulardi TaxID=63433 RepID=UPI0021F6223F|nr:uncharacterized protein LOC127285469 [Leptopilina boulardi]